MPRYVCLLRGVNVGGRNKVAMARLRAVFESLGHSGPADWCFSVVFLIVISTLTGLYIYACRRLDEH